ncbi:MAG: hypothetical protein K8R60_04720 [Burkholderiales bacterium]|nr:hypothetical protein [Burkholderiales bacterium]
MKPKLLLKYENAAEIDSRTYVVVEPRLSKLFAGIKVSLKPIGEKAASKVSAKNPAFWYATFVADKLVVTLKIGSSMQVIGEFDLGSVADPKRRKQIVDSLKDEGILDAAEVAGFMRRHPDKTRLAELRQAVAEKLKAMEALKNELMTLKAELAGSGG